MTDRKETVEDIVAEMRNKPIPQHKRDREMLVRLAERIEVAWRRERTEMAVKVAMESVKITNEKRKRDGGNVAMLREAVESFVNYWGRGGHDRLRESRLMRTALAALAAPPRNCDRFASVEEAVRTWGEETQPWEWDGDEEDEEDYFAHLLKDQVTEFMDWLMDTAKEGGQP